MLRNRRESPLCVLLIACLLLGPYPSLASTNYSAPAAFELKQEPDRKRTFLLPPFFSFLLPGLDQWWEEQYPYAFGYSGAAIGASLYLDVARSNYGDSRHETLAFQIYTAAGGYSLYHAFRSAVYSRKPFGEFTFLVEDETPDDVLLAPFRFGFITRPTTFIPLAIAGGVAVYAMLTTQEKKIALPNLTFPDVFFASSASYLAGTWEEPVFRGWMMPVAMHYLGSWFFADLISSALFAAAHVGGGFIPWPQFIFGFYAGWLTQHRNWTISEAIFIHTWWDFILFLTTYGLQRDDIALRLPVLYLRF